MRRACSALLVLALAVPASTASARSKKKPAAPPPAAAAAPVVVHPVLPPEPPKPTLARLMAADQAGVKAELGVPDVARDEGAGALWTYRWDDCAVMVFFRKADGRTLRVSGAEATARRPARRAPTVDACLAKGVSQDRAADLQAIDALLGSPG